MPNELDEVTGPTRSEGRDVRVIDKQLPVTVGTGSTLFEIGLWLLPIAPGLTLLVTRAATLEVAGTVLAIGLIPGIVFLLMKVAAGNYFSRLQQKIQAARSEIDNYLEQRDMILRNVGPILEQAIGLDTEVMTNVAAYRGGASPLRGGAGGDPTQRFGAQERAFIAISAAQEAYPELKAHAAIADAMRQNSYLQKEITAARSFYNDNVTQWNTDVFRWPTKQIVAARRGFNTIIPFSTTSEIRDRARGVYF